MESRSRVFGVMWLALALLAGCKTMSAGKVVYRIKVESGDTLASIATKYDTTWDRIAKLNGIAPGTAVKPGTVIRVEPGPGGHVAGLSPSTRPVKKSARLGRGAAPSSLPQLAPASPDEFTEEDIPEDGARTPRRGGLLYSGDRRAALSWPLQGELSSRFGLRDGKVHQGIDIRSPRGTPIVAAGRGVVEFAGSQNGYGNTVIVDHGGYRTLYAHMAKLRARRGQMVDERTVIGTVGTSGNASGPHLHFEVRSKEDKSFDPLTMLEEDQLLSARR